MNTLAESIKEMNREVLNLKTSQPLGANMKTFYFSINLPSSGDAAIHEYEITYVSGNLPIMAWVYCDTTNLFVLMAPDGSAQRMIDTAKWQTTQDRNVIIMSNRQILGVRKVS